MANRLDENEYLKFPISKDKINGLVNINVKIIIERTSCIEKITNLYIILTRKVHF